MQKSTKPTPNYFHVCDGAREFRGKVYEPEADSFLFLDALDADRDFLARLAPTVVLEVGVGSGVVCSHCCLHCLPASHRGVACIGIDINRTALMATRETWRATRCDYGLESGGGGYPATSANNGHAASTLSLLHSSGLGAVRDNTVDVVLFNPPYVPTSSAEMLAAQSSALSATDELPAAWCGGIAGREVCDAILSRVSRALVHPTGVAYVVALRENDIDGMLAVVNAGAALVGREMSATTVALRWTGEHLRVVRFAFVSVGTAAVAAAAAAAAEGDSGIDEEEEEWAEEAEQQDEDPHQ